MWSTILIGVTAVLSENLKETDSSYRGEKKGRNLLVHGISKLFLYNYVNVILLRYFLNLFRPQLKENLGLVFGMPLNTDPIVYKVVVLLTAAKIVYTSEYILQR